MNWLIDALRDPSIKHLDVDSDDRLAVHRHVLARKRLLRMTFKKFHHIFDRCDRKFFSGSGIRIELGAGIAPIRNTYADVLATDIVAAPGLDRVLDAQNMDVESVSVRALFGQNCFHHFPQPTRFFSEAERVLTPGGGIVLIEPYYGPLATFLYPRLFHTEGYDKNFHSWETPTTGPMIGANQALSYIIFERDRAQFEQMFPKLHIVHQETCGNYLTYLLSGGLNFRQLMPDAGTPLVCGLEWLLSPFNRWLALHHVIVIRKVTQ